MHTKDEPPNFSVVEVAAMMPTDDFPVGATACSPVST